MLADLPRRVATARVFLAENEDCTWLDGGPAGFEPRDVQVLGESSFALVLVHPADDDGLCRVVFEHEHPIECGRDD